MAALLIKYALAKPKEEVMADVIEILAFSILGGIIGAKIGVRRAEGESWPTIIEAGVKWCVDLVAGAYILIRDAFRKCFKKTNDSAKDENVTT